MRFLKGGLLLSLVAGTAGLLFVAGKTIASDGGVPADAVVPPVAPAPVPQNARAELKDRTGKPVGSATLTEEPHGVRIEIRASGLPAGRHGFHIHEVGRCDPPQFTSAGAHLNPTAHHHGMENPAGPHGGDLPNLVIESDGTGSLTVLNPYVTLVGEGGNSLFHPGGTTLIIHAGPDDYFTNPAGNSGERIACGVVTRG